MIRLGTAGRARDLTLVEHSPLRRADPRTKLALCLCASLAVMLELEKLVTFMLLYGLLLVWARLFPQAARQVWRLKWVLVVLLVVDWWLVNLELAVVTPPVGLNLYTLKSCVPSLSLEEIIRSSIPFLIIQLLCLLMFTFYPPLSLWLPNMVK